MSYITLMQESFAQCVATGMGLSEAYRVAYNTEKMKPATVHRHAWTLSRNAKVVARIAELKGDALERHRETVDNLLDELDEVASVALTAAKPQPAAAAAAIMGKAKLLGLAPDKVEMTGRNGGPIEMVQLDPTKLSTEALASIVAARDAAIKR